MNTQTQEALKMAIEAFEYSYSYLNKKEVDKKAINACKEALESQEQKPFAIGNELIKEAIARIPTHPEHGIEWLHPIPPRGTLLYTHPAQPLSDDEIDDMILNRGHLDCVLDYHPQADTIEVLQHELRRIARAIERAHGIGK